MKTEAFDRSPTGTKSCFRNETLNKGAFKWTPQWQIPESGTFEFDFVYMPPGEAPSESEGLSDQQFLQFKEWFLTKMDNLTEIQENEITLQAQDDETAKKPKQEINRFENDFTMVFKIVADFITLSCNQLFDFVNIIKDDQWRVQVLVAGLGRCHDFKNRDMVKHYSKTPEVS